MSDYAFWEAQLAGENPETTPGTPHAGFYRGGSSGKPYRAKMPETYIAIWQEDGLWIARIDHTDGQPPYMVVGWRVDEFIFPRCCRNAISYEDYLKGTKAC